MISLRILLLTFLLLPAGAGAGSWSAFETAKDNGRRLAPIGTPAAAEDSSGAITVDPALRFQRMVGFGGALTESAAWTLAQLPPEKRMEVIRGYYDPREGIGYTLARTHLNSCDFSLNTWSLDEVPGDFDLRAFTLEPMRRWLMPLLRDARRTAGADRFRLLVSPWSPPAWMKTNNRMDDGGRLRPEYRDAWARYFARFAEAMRREEGIPIWAFTVQNEPEARQTWESCLFTPEEERDFVRDHLGPTLARAGLSDIKLIGWDHNRDHLERWAGVLLGDPKAAGYLWGLGTHWYLSDDFAACSRVHAAFPGKPILFTEGCNEGGDSLGRWDHGENYASQMIADFKNWVCGFIDWNIVLDERGGPNHVGNFCDAPVIVDTRTGQVRVSGAFYYIAHFSRFVRPGARRIGSAGGPADLRSVAFANPDGGLVVVVLNTGASAVDFRLAEGGRALACRIPGRAIQTYLRQP